MPFSGYVARFAEHFDLWEGLPFYDSVTREIMAEEFCLCVGGIPTAHNIVCPGVASSFAVDRHTKNG